MKPKELAVALGAAAELLEAAGASAAAARLAAVAVLFAEAREATVAAVAKRLAATPPVPATAGARLGDAAPLLPALAKLLAATGKAAGAKDAAALAGIVAAHANSDPAALAAAGAAPPPATRRKAAAAALDETLIDSHRRALDASLFSGESFALAFAALEADEAMGKAEMTALAKRFAGGAATRTRDDALRRIWNRHAAVLTAQAKAKATGGRSAA